MGLFIFPTFPLGFPWQIHRGFETIIINKGFYNHSDSLGTAGCFGQGKQAPIPCQILGP